jgi:2-oxoglutarate ferredoxin oxidoreductase subunit delta
MKQILIDKVYCKGCNLCITVCPKEALVQGKSRSNQGYLMPDFIIKNCIGCRNCELICPDMAISIKEVN